MIDTHYDLLTIAYLAYLKKDSSYLEEIVSYFRKDNVRGVIANLYFMSEEEMIKELDPCYYQKNVSVLEMFCQAKHVLDMYLPDLDILYSIEGADYIKDEVELERLYDAGLDALMLTWNTPNKYASGNRGSYGLTEVGKILLKKAISLGMGIDLSHANARTFDDMIALIQDTQKKGVAVCCYASHSNSRKLCNRERNLTDVQLRKLRSVGGVVGVFAHLGFVLPAIYPNIDSRDYYLQHIEYISSIMGIDHVALATDDMNFCKDADPVYGEVSIYNYANLATEVLQTLEKKYSKRERDQLMYQTAKEKIFDKIRNYRKGRGVIL